MQTPTKRPLLVRELASKISTGTALAVLMLVACALLVGFVRLTWQEHQTNQAIQRQQAANESLRARNQQLKGQADFAESDSAVERAARERLGMAREGETVLKPNIVLPPTPTAAPLQAAPLLSDTAVLTPTAAPSVRANAIAWWQALFPGSAVQP